MITIMTIIRRLICFFVGHRWDMKFPHAEPLRWRFTCERCGKITHDMQDTF